MKFIACLVLALTMGAASASAAVEQCRLIKAKVDREACYEHQAASAAAKRKPVVSDNSKIIDTVEALKLEDDKLAKRLQGICRGC